MRTQRRLLLVVSIVFAALVFTFPIAILFFRRRYQLGKSYERFKAILGESDDKVLWVFGKVFESPVATYSMVCLGVIERWGKARVMEIYISNGEQGRALEILADMFPGAIVGHGSGKKRLFKKRVRESLKVEGWHRGVLRKSRPKRSSEKKARVI